MRYRTVAFFAYLALASFAFGQTPLTISLSELPPLGTASIEGNGILGQFVAEAFRGKQYEISYKYVPFARIVALVEQNAVQAAFFNPLQADEDKYFVKTILTNSIVFFYKKSRFPDGLTFRDISELGKYKIGIVRSAPTVKMLEDAGLTLDHADNDLLNFKKLQHDRIDLVSTIDILGWYTLQKNGMNRDEYGTTKPIILVESCLIISRTIPNAQKIHADFVSGYEDAKKQGLLTAILETLYGSGNVPTNALP